MNCNEPAKNVILTHLHNEKVEDYLVNIFPQKYVCCHVELDQGYVTRHGGDK